MQDGGWEAWATMVLANLKNHDSQIKELRDENDRSSTQLWDAVEALRLEVGQIRDCRVEKDHLLELDVNTLKVEAKIAGQDAGKVAGQKAGRDISTWISIAISAVICLLDWIVTNWPLFH